MYPALKVTSNFTLQLSVYLYKYSHLDLFVFSLQFKKVSMPTECHVKLNKIIGSPYCSPPGCLTVCVCMLSGFNLVWLFGTTWTVAHQAPLSRGFSRQEYWSGLPCCSPRESSQPRDQIHICLCCLHLQMSYLPLVPPGKPSLTVLSPLKKKWFFSSNSLYNKTDFSFFSMRLCIICFPWLQVVNW